MADRENIFRLRLTMQERAQLDQLAELSGLTRAALIRKLLDGVEIKARPPAEYGALVRELAAIGNNINQLARIANATHALPPEEMGRALAYSRRAWELLKGTL